MFFRCYFLISGKKSLKNIQNEQKKLNMAKKKYLDQLLGACSMQKLVEIHNK